MRSCWVICKYYRILKCKIALSAWIYFCQRFKLFMTIRQFILPIKTYMQVLSYFIRTIPDLIFPSSYLTPAKRLHHYRLSDRIHFYLCRIALWVDNTSHLQPRFVRNTSAFYDWLASKRRFKNSRSTCLRDLGTKRCRLPSEKDWVSWWQFSREDWVELPTEWQWHLLLFLLLIDLFEMLWEIEHLQNKCYKVFIWRILKLKESLKLAWQLRCHCLLLNDKKNDAWIDSFQESRNSYFPCQAAILWRKISYGRISVSPQDHFTIFWANG